MKSRRKIRKGGVTTRGQTERQKLEELRAELESQRRGDRSKRTREAALYIAKKMGSPEDVARLSSEDPKKGVPHFGPATRRKALALAKAMRLQDEVKRLEPDGEPSSPVGSEPGSVTSLGSNPRSVASTAKGRGKTRRRRH